MQRKTTLYILLGVLLALGTGLTAFRFRPITIQDGEQDFMVRGPFLRVEQALSAAGLHLAPDDQVTPALTASLPLDGRIQIARASHLTLWEAGEITRISGVAAQAADLLALAGVRLANGDRLSWNALPVTPDLALEPGKSYVLQIERAAALQLDEDGQTRSVHTLGPTLARGLWDAGVHVAPGDRLSAQPGSLLTGQDQSVAIRHARKLRIYVAGQVRTAQSAAERVGAALADAGVSLQSLDYSLPAEDQPIPTDGNIRVVRVSETLEFTQTLLPYDSALQPDPTLALDQRRTIEAGHYGIQVSRERVRYEDGQEVSRALDSDWVASEPQTQVVGYGTLAAAHTTDTPDGSIEYYRAVTVYATTYSPCHLGKPDYCNSQTASGAPLTKGIIAVSQAWYRLFAGQRVYVEGYGFATIADTGYGIPGTTWIDLGYDDDNFPGGARTTTLYFLTPIPENVPWTLP